MARLPAATRALVPLLVLLAGCSGGDSDDVAGGGGPIVIKLWHGQKQQNKAALEDVVARFNAAHPEYKVVAIRVADYTALFNKVRTTILGNDLPDLCVAYESMVAELMAADVVLPLDDSLDHPDYGLSKEDQADIFPTFLQSNRYAQFDGKLLTFPFTKSLLMLYYNADLLRAAGHEKPATTWKAFIQQCRDVKAHTGKPALAYARDASSFDSMILSLGGRLAVNGRSNLGSAESVRALGILDTLIREGIARYIPIKTYDDRTLFVNQSVAFIFRSSTTRAYMLKDIQDEQGRDRFDWQMACPPVGEGQPTRTVCFGGNICVFKSTPERQRGAWEFIKFFISPAVTAEWSVRTGYLPVRRSAAATETLKSFFAEHPRNRAAFDTLPFGVFEPPIDGWQGVRKVILQALTHICKGSAAPAEVAADMASKADRILARKQATY